MPTYAPGAYVSTCSASRNHQYYEEPIPAPSSSSGAQFADVSSSVRTRRRRHSSYNHHHRTLSIDHRGNVPLLVDKFLADLGKRLELMECYGHLKIDEGMKCAYDTLYSVHERCESVRDDIMDAGRRKAKVLVETLEGQYHGALATKDTLELKVLEGLRIMESVCEDLERRAYDVHRVGFAATAHDVLDSSRAIMEDASSKAVGIVSEGAVAALRAKELLKQKIDDAIQQARLHGLISYEHLPDPWRNNPYIKSGYRFSETWIECLRSCFTTLSNETVNIWSHAIGLVMVLAVAFYIYPSTPAFSEATAVDIFITGCFFFAACKCLICSIMWHAMSSISNQTTMERFACVDYSGISLLVAASIMTTEYTAFYCEPWPRWVYLTVTFALGTIGSVLPWHPIFHQMNMSWFRVAFYVGLGATGFVPILQLTIERGWRSALYFYAPITKSIVVYLLGAFLYAAKIPEIWRPGWFDYVGASHNIWHVAVLGGILFHYSAIQEFFGDAFARRASAEMCSSGF